MHGRPEFRALIAFVAFSAAASFSCAVGSTYDLTVTEDNLEPCRGSALECPDRQGPEASDPGSDARAADDAPDSGVATGDATVTADAAAIDGGSDAAPTIANASDTCNATALAAAGVVQAGLGSPALFTIALDGATDTFKSGCILASGPDRIQPIVATNGTRLRISVTDTKSISGAVVVYAKATCGASVDLACSSSGPIDFAAQAGVTYFVHFDTTGAQASGARITALAEVL